MKRWYPRQIRRLVMILLALGVLLAAAGVSREWFPLCGLGIAVMVGAILFHLLFYRCPCCGKFLDRSTGDFCPYCGKQVNPEAPPENKR